MKYILLILYKIKPESLIPMGSFDAQMLALMGVGGVGMWEETGAPGGNPCL